MEKKDKNRHLTTRVVFAMLFAIILVSVNVRAPVKAESLWDQIADTAHGQLGQHYLWGTEGEGFGDGPVVESPEYPNAAYTTEYIENTTEWLLKLPNRFYCQGRSDVVAGDVPRPNTTRPIPFKSMPHDTRPANEITLGESCFGKRHFDCSGLVWWTFHQCGVDVTRNSSQEYYNICYPGIPKELLQEGDLTFVYDEHGRIYHVGIVYCYVKGDDSKTFIVEALNPAHGVVSYRTLYDWIQTYSGRVCYGDLLSSWGKVTTTGGAASGPVCIRESDILRQDAFELGAQDLEVKLWQPEDNIDVTGWKIKFQTFTMATSQYGDQPEPAHHLLLNTLYLPQTKIPDNGKHAVDAKAFFDRDDMVVKFNHIVTVSSVFYLTWWNVKHAEYTWTRQGADPKKAVPCHGWSVDWPVPYIPTLRGHIPIDQWAHMLNIVNEDSNETFTVTGFTYNATMDYIEDLATISFPPPRDNFSLAPGETWKDRIVTNGSLIGGHIYFKYAIEWNGVEVFESITDHEVTSRPSVGGIVVPVDKFGLLAPYIGVASTTIVAAVATAVCVKRVKRRKEKQ